MLELMARVPPPAGTGRRRRSRDLADHRRMLLAGLVLFGLTSLAPGLATSFVVLVVARFARALSIFQAATAGGATAGIVQVEVRSVLNAVASGLLAGGVR